MAEYKWKTEPTGFQGPVGIISRHVLELGNGMRVDVTQTKFRSETSDRAYGVRLMLVKNGMQSCLAHVDDMPALDDADAREKGLRAMLDIAGSRLDEAQAAYDNVMAAALNLTGAWPYGGLELREKTVRMAVAKTGTHEETPVMNLLSAAVMLSIDGTIGDDSPLIGLLPDGVLQNRDPDACSMEIDGRNPEAAGVIRERTDALRKVLEKYDELKGGGGDALAG